MGLLYMDGKVVSSGMSGMGQTSPLGEMELTEHCIGITQMSVSEIAIHSIRFTSMVLQ
jgi:hypothetical protein